MTMSPDFRDYLLDQLAPMGGIEAKRMFGGGGLYRDGAMFGLVADDVLEDPDELCAWAGRAWEAARRSGRQKKKKKTAPS